MYNECRHILPGGHKCRSAALRGKAFCFYHVASRRPVTNRVPETGPLNLSSIEDGAGVSLALDQVLQQLSKGHIDRSLANTFLRGIQIANSIARKNAAKQRPGDTVRELCEDPSDGTIAPEKTACDPEDCAECEKRYNCKDTEFKESDEDFRSLIAEFRRETPED